MTGIRQLALTSHVLSVITAPPMLNSDVDISLKTSGRVPLTYAIRSDSRDTFVHATMSVQIFRNRQQSLKKFYESKKYSKGLDNREYIVARYSPPGNVGTRYHTNLEANACAATNSCMSTDYSQIGNNCNGK